MRQKDIARPVSPLIREYQSDVIAHCVCLFFLSGIAVSHGPRRSESIQNNETRPRPARVMCKSSVGVKRSVINSAGIHLTLWCRCWEAVMKKALERAVTDIVTQSMSLIY